MNVEPITASPWVIAALGASATLAIVGPVVAALLLVRRSGASLVVAAAGAGVFFVSQIVLRFPWQIPLGIWLGPRIAGSSALTTAWLGASALTAALFEEVGRWAGYRWLVPKARTYDEALVYGVGHGGIESILLVGLGLAASAT